MKKPIQKIDEVLRNIEVKEAEQIKDNAGSKVDSEFSIRSVMVLREAVIDLYQQTGFMPPTDIEDKLRTIKDKHDRLDRIKVRRAELEADAQAGKHIDLDTGWD